MCIIIIIIIQIIVIVIKKCEIVHELTLSSASGPIIGGFVPLKLHFLGKNK